MKRRILAALLLALLAPILLFGDYYSDFQTRSGTTAQPGKFAVVTNGDGTLSPRVVVDGGAISSTPAGTQRTPTLTSVSASGTVTAGAKSVTFILSSDFAGTILGTTVSGSTDSSFPYFATGGDTLAALAYTRTAGSLRISEIR